MPTSAVPARRVRTRKTAVVSAAAVALLFAAGALILGSGPGTGPAVPAGADSPTDAVSPAQGAPSADLLAYAGPEQASRLDLGPGPYTLPDDPCTALTEETLAGLGHTASSGVPGERGCSWSALSPDGGLHGLSVSYTAWEDADRARHRFDEEFARVRGDEEGVHWDQSSNAGEQSRLALAERDGAFLATLLAHQGEVHVTVVRAFTPGPGGGEGADRSVEVRLLGELGRQALGRLG
ncbi:hypothetical protein [Nocardiopsis sp. NPDC057823]|uniref:hypothetical protein n=1 Tax=Nocardiopsis sp. NPDC057823 TaxID=3346256 RepID=UPI0036712F44